MRRVLLIILALAFGLTSADARRRGHRHHHHDPYAYVFPRDIPAMTAPRMPYRGLPRERPKPLPAPGDSSGAVPAGAVDAWRAHDAGQAGQSTTKQTLNVPRAPLHVIVSLRDQRVTLYRNGVPLAHSKISTGTRDHPTPTGIFSVIQKKIWHESNIYSFAPMPYMQRITWSGIALHAGVVPGYPASHGCIRLPIEFAKLLWNATKIGARVIVAPTAVGPVEIAHPRLATLDRKPATEPLVMGGSGDWASTNAVDGTASSKVAAAATTAEMIPNQPAANETNASLPVAQDAPRRGELVSVFVSRKEAKLYVRAGFQQLFESPVAIQQPELELGTHVFTAMEAGRDGVTMRWVAVSMPNASSEPAGHRKNDGKNLIRHPQAEAPVTALAPTAMVALDRIEMPQDAIARISELLSPGASLIISDQGISAETGQGTDFIVLMPSQKTQTSGTGHQIVRRH